MTDTLGRKDHKLPIVRAVLGPISIPFEMWRDRESGRMSLDLYWRGWNQLSNKVRAIALVRARNEKKEVKI